MKNNAINTVCALCTIGLLGLASPSLATQSSEELSPAEKAFKGANINDSMLGLPAVPYKVILNQQNARVFAQSKMRLIDSNNQKVLLISLPKNAKDIQLSLPLVDGKSQGQILTWYTTMAEPFPAQGSLEKQRKSLESIIDLEASMVDTLQVRYAALKEKYVEHIKEGKTDELESILTELSKVSSQQSAKHRAWQNAKNLVNQMSFKTAMSQKMTVVLDTPLPAQSIIHLKYAYTLEDSHWRPSYNVSANSSDDSITIQLTANITQDSNLDWDNTEIEFSTIDGTNSTPNAIQPWIVSERNEQVLYSKTREMPVAMSNQVQADSVASFQDSATLSSWTMNKQLIIPEGKSSIVLLEKSAEIPLERIARPNTRYNPDGTVWLSAKYNLKDLFLPVGQANYLLDGVVVGKGRFQPNANEVDLFFGPDPLVTVDIKRNVRKSEQSGIINKEKVYVWNWVYTVYNKRSKSVKVRIEEPKVQVGPENISVKYNDMPKAKAGPDNTLIWDLTVPAKNSTVVKRSITINVPEKMKVDLGR